MSELYWITRFGAINGCATTFLVLSSIISIVVLILIVLCIADEDEKGLLICKKISNVSVPTFIVSLLLAIFVPTTKEALIIYGVGGSIDYLRSNPTASKLPDKCIETLDMWINEYYKSKKTEK